MKELKWPIQRRQLISGQLECETRCSAPKSCVINIIMPQLFFFNLKKTDIDESSFQPSFYI